MFNTILGLPAHPLLIHAAVVLTPLLIAVVIGYAAVPRLRSRLDWAVVVLAIGAPLAVYAAKTSGLNLRARLVARQEVSAQDLVLINRHMHFATTLFPWSIVLGVVALGMVAVVEGRRRGKIGGHPVIGLVVSVVAVALAVPTAYYLYKTGDSGAHAVWGSR